MYGFAPGVRQEALKTPDAINHLSLTDDFLIIPRSSSFINNLLNWTFRREGKNSSLGRVEKDLMGLGKFFQPPRSPGQIVSPSSGVADVPVPQLPSTGANPI